MKKAIVLSGLPGCGKSTLLKREMESFISESFIYSTDDYIEEMCTIDGITYDQGFFKYIKEAHNVMNLGLDRAMDEGKNVVWDQTNLSVKKRKSIINKLKDYVVVSIAFVKPRNEEERKEINRRLEDRRVNSGKSIPEHILKNMEQNYVYPTEDEGFEGCLKSDIYGNPII